MADSMLVTSHGRIAMTDSAGSGPAVLMLHGNSSCRHAFVEQFSAPFAAAYRMVAFDLPGHGESDDADDPRRTYTIPGYADLTMEVLAALDIRCAAILGWSLGGHIGLEIMARWPQLAGLMIVGTPPVAPSPDAIAAAFLPSGPMTLAGKEHFTGEDVEAYTKTMYGGAPLSDRLRDAVRRADGRARRYMMEAAYNAEGVDGRFVAETSNILLAVVSGANEPFVNNAELTEINYASLWRDEICILADAGHAPFLETPQNFNALFQAFLADLPLYTIK